MEDTMYPTCSRCLRKVYSAEEKQAYGKVWHLFCFSCRLCKKLLEDENDASRDGDGDIYCSECFERRNEDSSGDGAADSGIESTSDVGVVCSHPPVAARAGISPAVTTFYARFNRRMNARSKRTEDGGAYFGKPFPLYPDNNGSLWSIGTTPTCNRCGNKVFHAEARQVEGRLYHDCCFSCHCCLKPLNATSVNVSHGNIYCKACFLRIEGPDGYGFGAGAGTLQSF